MCLKRQNTMIRRSAAHGVDEHIEETRNSCGCGEKYLTHRQGQIMSRRKATKEREREKVPWTVRDEIKNVSKKRNAKAEIKTARRSDGELV